MPHAHNALKRVIIGRTRLFISLGFGLFVMAALPDTLRLMTRIVLGWDALTLSYVILTGSLMINSDVSHCKHRASIYDEGDWIILIVTVLGAITSFFAIISELAASKAAGQAFITTFSFTAVTVVLSWAFTHMIFALHYANLFYRTNDCVNFHAQHDYNLRSLCFNPICSINGLHCSAKKMGKFCTIS